MSLPREWSFQDTRGSLVRLPGPHGTPDISGVQDLRVLSPFADSLFQGLHGHQGLQGLQYDNTLLAGVDDNQNSLSGLSGSLFSIHSAPVLELGPHGPRPAGIDSPKRPCSLLLERPTSLVISHPHSVASADTADDEDNDNLLTISSLTARPLIAKSRELRSSRKLRKARGGPRTRRQHVPVAPPDGGYGWAIVTGAFFVQFWVAGLVKSYGVLFVEIMETFPESSASVASWIPAILSALCLVLAPLSSALCQKYSCRAVVFTGGLFCALGLTISYFATSLVHLFFTFGVLTGIGGGLSTTPGIVIVSQYFDKHRALANGLCVSGTAAGSIVFPMLIERLVDAFGFHGTILILGGCMLHVCASATLYRPLNPQQDLPEERQCLSASDTAINISGKHDNINMDDRPLDPLHSNRQLEYLFMSDPPNNIDPKIRNNLINEFLNQAPLQIEKNISDIEEEKDVIGETLFMKPIRSIRSSSILHSVEDLSTDSTFVYKSRQRHPLSRSMFLPKTAPPQLTEEEEKTSLPKKRRTCYEIISRYLDVSLLKDIDFILMCLSVTLMSTGSPYMLYYLPAYVLSAGYSKSEAGYLVAISAALDLFGRLSLGWLSDLQLFDRRKGYIGSIVGAGLAVLMLPLARGWWVLAIAAGCYGLCLGCWFLLVPVLLADQFGTDRISSSYGLVRMFQSVGAISVPPLAGYMRDVTGGYEYCFYCMGTCMVLGGVPLLLGSPALNGGVTGASDTDSEPDASVGTATTTASQAERKA